MNNFVKKIITLGINLIEQTNENKQIVPRHIQKIENNPYDLNNNEGDEEFTVNSFGSSIFFTGAINSKSINALILEIIKVNNEMLKMNNEKENIERGQSVEAIDLYINSIGGSLLNGFIGGDFIKNSSIFPINTLVQKAASSATILSCSGAKKFINANGFMLIHQISSSLIGKYSELKDDYDNSTLFMSKLIKFYKKNTKMSDEKINELLNKDIWLDAETCLELGLVDMII